MVAPEHREFLIRREVLVTLYSQVPNATLGNSVGGVLLCAALWEVESHGALAAWALLVVGASAIRYGCYRAFVPRIGTLDAAALPRWECVLQWAVALQTVAWSLSLVMIWPQQPEFRGVVVGTLIGVMAVGAVLLSIHRRMLMSYELPVVLPLVARLLADDLLFERWLVVLSVFYLFLLLLASRKQAAAFRETVGLRLDMEALSRIDPLTRLANRRTFDESLASLWSQSARAQTPLALLYLDVDHFKSYNDNYGHPGGDLVLQQVARAIRGEAARSADCVARIGGEEFALLLPYTDEDGARAVAQQLLVDVRELGIPHGGSPRGIVSVSVGVAVCVPEPGAASSSLVDAADGALYRAKHGGRDRVELA